MAKKLKRYTNLYVKRRLVKLEIDIFGIISNGILHHTPKRQIMLMIQKEIKLLSVQLELDQEEINELWRKAVEAYNQIQRQTVAQLRVIDRKFGKDSDYKEALEARQAAIYNSIRARIQNNDLVKAANQVVAHYDHRFKEADMENLLEKAQNIQSPFFLASAHDKPAKDHAPYESKIYYDEEWESYVSKSDQPAIRAYIRNHKLMTVQAVTGEGIWFTLRRNCKHYLINVSVDEVLHNSARSLVKKHKMIHPHEEPASQDLLNYREYYNRLKIMDSLYNLIPNKELLNDMKRTKKMLIKWKETL